MKNLLVKASRDPALMRTGDATTRLPIIPEADGATTRAAPFRLVLCTPPQVRDLFARHLPE
jgi:hypothetical protein